MNRTGRPFNGILLLNKPSGITSHDAVSEVRKIIKQRRVGHTGTLDPRATGLLVVCVGRATKIAQFISDMDKSYEARIYLGMKSRTFDADGVDEMQQPMPVPDLNPEIINALLSDYIGVIKQRVPIYSAVRVQGQRLYKMARNGNEVEPPEREIEIKEIELLEYKKPEMTIRVTCSKGTYIRTLANDIGERLECGAYLSNLKRISVGHLNIRNAYDFNDIREACEQNTLHTILLRYQQVLNYPAFRISDEFKPFVISGKDPQRADITAVHGKFKAGDRIVLRDSLGRNLAVGTAEIDSDKIDEAEPGVRFFNYVRVLN